MAISSKDRNLDKKDKDRERKKSNFRESLKKSFSMPTVSKSKSSELATSGSFRSASAGTLGIAHSLRHKLFLRAATQKDPKLLLSFICPMGTEESVDINYTNCNSENALFFAVGNKDSESVDVLMTRGCAVNTISNTGMTLLHTAAAAGNHIILSRLLDKTRPDLVTHKAWDGCLPLHYGAAFGTEKCVQLLLDRGSKINASNKKGYTPLAFCINNNGPNATLKLLLEKGANVNKRYEATGSKSFSPLHILVSKSKPGRPLTEAAKVMVDFGAKIEGCKTCKNGLACKGVDQAVLDIVVSEVRKKQSGSKSSLPSLQGPITLADVDHLIHAIKSDSLRKVKHIFRSFRIDSIHSLPLPDKLVQEQKTLLHIAAAEGAIKSAGYLIRKGANVNTKTTKQWTPLHEACYEGHLLLCDFLLNKGAIPNSMTDEGILPFHYFVSHNFAKKIEINEMYIYHRVFEKLSGGGEFVNRQSLVRRESPLHYACLRMETAENVRLLTQLKVDVNLKDKRGNTALHISIINKRKPIVKLLLEAGADPSLTSSAGTCFELAKGESELLAILTQYQQAAEKKLNGENNCNLFFTAIKNGDLETVKLEIEKLQWMGLTIMDVPLPTSYDSDKRTWLHIVAAEGHIDIVRFFLQSKSDVNAVSSNGWTPLHEAANGGHLFICDELMQRGADPAAKTNEGNLALHYFVSHSYAALQHDFVSMYKFLRVFDRLTGQKTLLNAQTILRKETPLHYACRKNDTKTNTLLLLKDGADPNILDKRGNTPLHVSIQLRKLELVNVLLEFGADFNVKCGDKTVFDLAKDKADILAALEKARDGEVIPEGGAEEYEDENSYDTTETDDTDYEP